VLRHLASLPHDPSCTAGALNELVAAMAAGVPRVAQ
jgi:hypothetical protein